MGSLFPEFSSGRLVTLGSLGACALLVSSPAPSAPQFPVHLQGEWCQLVYRNICDDLAIELRENGNATVTWRRFYPNGSNLVTNGRYRLQRNPVPELAIYGYSPYYHVIRAERDGPGCISGGWTMDVSYTFYGLVGTVEACM